MAKSSRVFESHRVRIALLKDDAGWRKMEFAQDHVVVPRLRPIDLNGAHLRLRPRAYLGRARGPSGEGAGKQDAGDNGITEDVHAVNLDAWFKKRG
jgi:hypothetical protein